MKKVLGASAYLFALLAPLAACSDDSDDVVEVPGEGVVVESDGEIAAVIGAANAAEIQQGNLATQRARRTPTQAFAQAMVTEHSAAQARVDQLLAAQGIAPVNNQVSDGLQAEFQGILDDLNAASLADFDRVYLDAQVEVHERVLNLLDEQLIPAAQNPELQQELQTTRTAVASHLQQAQTLIDGLENDAVANNGGVAVATDTSGEGAGGTTGIGNSEWSTGPTASGWTSGPTGPAVAVHAGEGAGGTTGIGNSEWSTGPTASGWTSGPTGPAVAVHAGEGAGGTTGIGNSEWSTGPSESGWTSGPRVPGF